MSDVQYSEASTPAPATVGDTEIPEAAQRVSARRRDASEQRGDPPGDEPKKLDTGIHLDEPRSSKDSEGNDVDEGYTPRRMANALSKSREEARERESQERELWSQYHTLVREGEQSETNPAPEQPRIAERVEHPPTHAAPHVESQQRQQALQQIAQIDQAILQAVPAEFPEIRWGTAFVQHDMQALAQSNPERFQRLAEAFNYIQQVDAHRNQLWSAESQYQEHTAWKAQQDRILAEKLPELKTDARGNYLTPQKAVALQHQLVAHFRELGYSDNELSAAIADRTLDARAILLAIDSIRLKELRDRAKTFKAQAVQKPPVQRPGVSRPRVSASEENLNSLRGKAFQSRNLRDMARYVAARRRAEAR